MPRSKSNGHAGNGQLANGHAEKSRDYLRAPSGGIRLGGRFYQGGSRLPEKYRRQMASGERSHDPATGIPLTAPNMGRFVLPHAITFIGKQATISQVYRNPDEAVVKSGGQAWKMRRDPAIMECLEARQRATALLNWHLEVEDEKDPVQKELKDQMTKIVMRSKQFTEYRRNLLEALWYGRYAVEHQFGFAMIGGKRRCYLADWVPINGDKLVFRYDDGSGEYSNKEVGIRVTPIYGQQDKLAGDRYLEYTVDGGPAYFLEDWERSLIAIHRHIIEDGDYEDPISAGRIHGVGIRDRIYWCWFQKQETMAQLMEIIDRTGSGITIYWYPHGDPKAKEEVEELAEQQKHENVLIMPRMSADPSMDAYGIERIEPTTAGIEAMRNVVHEFFGHQIKRYISGQTLTSESEALGIGGGASDVQQETWFQIVCYDAVKLEETITEELIEPLKRFNFPEAHDIPIWFRIDTKSADSEKKMNAIRQGWDMGLRIKASDVMDIVGLSMPAADDEVLQNPQMAPQPQQMPGGMPGQGGGDQMHDLFGPLADLVKQGGEQGPEEGGGGGGASGAPPPNPSKGGGPAQYAKSGRADHSYSSTQFNLPDELAAAVRILGRQIPADDLAADGLELEPHVTVKYGLHTDDAEEVRRLVQDWPPIAIQLGDASCFPGKEHDVVKIEVCSQGLCDLNRHISENLEVTDTFPDYKPHVTIAYVKPGLGELYAEKLNTLKNRVAAFDRLIFSDKQRQHVSIPLVGPARYARRRQVESSPGQHPLPGLGDENSKQHHLWREQLHPRAGKGSATGGQFVDKSGTNTGATRASGATVRQSLPHQHGQGMLFSELASKLHETEQYPDSQAAKAKQEELFKSLAESEIHPEQVAALLSGDENRMHALQTHALQTGQHEMPSEAEASTPENKPSAEQSEMHAAVGKRFGIPPEAVRDLLNTSPDELAKRDKYLAPSSGRDVAVGPTTDFPQHPLGAAKIDSSRHGTGETQNAYVDYLREFDPHGLKLSEHEDGMSQSGSVQQYADWAKAGMKAPPISVFDSSNGNGDLVSTNRRRVLAARLAGTPITGWHGPNNPETGLPLKYGDVLKAAAEFKQLGLQAQQRAENPEAHPPSPEIESSNAPPAGMPGGSIAASDEGGFQLQQQKVREGAGPSTFPETSGEQGSFWHGMEDQAGQGKLFGGLDRAGETAEERPAFGDQQTEVYNAPPKSAEQEGTEAIRGMSFESREQAQAVARRLEEVGAKHGINGEELWRSVMGEPEGSSSWPLYDQTEDDERRAEIEKHRPAREAARQEATEAAKPRPSEPKLPPTKNGGFGRMFIQHGDGQSWSAYSDHKKGISDPREAWRTLQSAKKNYPDKQVRVLDQDGKDITKSLRDTVKEIVEHDPDYAGLVKKIKDKRLGQKSSQSSEAPAAASAAGASSPMSLATVSEHNKAIRAGESSADQIRQWFDEYQGNREPVKAELQKKSVAELKNMGAGGWHAAGMKKAELVEDLLNKIGNQYHVGESLSYDPFSEKASEALRRHVHAQTDEDVRKFAEKVKARQAERQQRKEQISKALENPETLDEFDTFIKAKGQSALSDEQLARYDNLKASGRRSQEAQQRSTVRGLAGGESKAGAVGIVEGHHQKRNQPTYTVTVENRLGDEGYREALSKARQLGGNYVNAMIAKRYRATPGFQFFDRSSAEKFAQVMRGESVDRSDAQGERKAEKIENASDRLAALAESTHAAADEQLGRDRQTNTSRRAEMAASAEASARGQKALAETMQRLSGAMKEGQAPHLEGIRNRAHVEQLNRELRSSRWARVQKADKAKELGGNKYQELLDKPPEAEDIRHAEYPYPKIWGSELQKHAAEFENEPGLKLIAARLKKAGAAQVKFKGQGGGFKFSGGRILSPKNVEDFEQLKLKGLPEDKGIRVHQSHDYQLAKAGHGRGPFYTADAGKSFGTSPEIAVSAALNRGNDLDIVDLPKDELITLDSPREISDLAAAASKLRGSSNRSLRYLGDQLHGRIESYNRLQAMDIKNASELRAALREYLPLRTKPQAEDKVKRMERELIGRDIPGFFPTPRPLIDQMIDAASIEPGQSVLEPSAGKGDILDAVRERHPEAQTEAIEPASSLRDIIEAKGHNLVGNDFLEHHGQYDRVLMNPPFEKGQDAEHVQHAYQQLKPGGRLVAVVSTGPFFRQDKKSEAFRQWLDEVGGTVEDLPAGSFTGKEAFRQTGVNTKLVVIDK